MFASFQNGPNGLNALTNARELARDSATTTVKIARKTKQWKRLNNATIAHASLTVSPIRRTRHSAIQTTNARSASVSKDIPNAIQIATVQRPKNHAKTSPMMSTSSHGLSQRLANVADPATRPRVSLDLSSRV